MGARLLLSMLGRVLRWLVDQESDLFVAVAGPSRFGADPLDQLAIMLERAAQHHRKDVDVRITPGWRHSALCRTGCAEGFRPGL